MRASVVALVVAGAACSPENVSNPFPVELGYRMLEPVSAAATLPVMGPDSAKGPYASGAGSGHFVWAHARGYVHASVAQVWAALHDPCVSRIYTNGGATTAAQMEPLDNPGHFPLFFGLRVSESSPVGTVQWVHEYRGGPATESSGAGRSGYGMRYQKALGIQNVLTQSGSLEIYPVVGHESDWTEIAMEHWLDVNGGMGHQPGIVDAEGAINDWFMNIVSGLDLPFDGQPVGAPWNYCPAPNLPLQP